MIHDYLGIQYEVTELPSLGPLVIDWVGEENVYFRIVNAEALGVHPRGWFKA